MIIFGIWNSFILKTVSLLLYDIFHKRENQLQNNFTLKYPSEKKNITVFYKPQQLLFLLEIKVSTSIV